MNYPDSLRALRHRNYRLYFSGMIAALAGVWMQQMAIGWLMYRLTDSVFMLGLAAFSWQIPVLLFASLGGVLADRYDRRKVFALALTAQATATGALAVVLASGVRTPMVLTALILLSSVMGAMGQPAYSAMLPDLVPAEELMAILSLGIFSWNSGRIVGPIVASLMAVALGPAWTVAFNAATFLVMAGAVTLLRRDFAPLGQGGGIVERLRDGWRAMRSTPGCWYGIRLIVLYNLTAVAFMGPIPFYAADLFDGSTGLAGTLASLQGLGAIVGGVVVTALISRFSRSTVLVGIVVSLTVWLTAFGLAPSRPIAMGSVFVLGGCATAYFLSTTSFIQRDAPASRRGREIGRAHV